MHHGFQGDVAGPRHGPLVILLEQDDTDPGGDSRLVEKDADHLGAPVDLAVDTLERGCRRAHPFASASSSRAGRAS